MASTQIQTWTGLVFDPLHPEVEKIDVRDIAHALSMQCRFSGHLDRFYSVAEHSVRMAMILESAGKGFAGLMHDGSEYALQDMASPLKSDPLLGRRYKQVEGPLMDAIAERFGLEAGFHKDRELKVVDVRMLATEWRDLLQCRRPVSKAIAALWDPWIAGVEPFAARIRPWSHRKAERLFLETFEKYAPKKGLRRR